MVRGIGKWPKLPPAATISARGSSSREQPPPMHMPACPLVTPPPRSRPPSPSATPSFPPSVEKMPMGHRQPHRVRRSLPDWLVLGASAWVLDTIAQLVKIPWTGRPPAPRARPYPAWTADAVFMEGEIQRQLDLGYVRELTNPAEWRHIKVLSLAFFVVRSSSGAERTDIDYRYPNRFMAQRKCRYETLADLAQVLRPADAILVWDVTDTYHHLLLRSEDALYLAFELDSRIFPPLKMPFGIRVAPYTWTKV